MQSDIETAIRSMSLSDIKNNLLHFFSFCFYRLISILFECFFRFLFFPFFHSSHRLLCSCFKKEKQSRNQSKSDASILFTSHDWQNYFKKSKFCLLHSHFVSFSLFSFLNRYVRYFSISLFSLLKAQMTMAASSTRPAGSRSVIKSMGDTT